MVPSTLSPAEAKWSPNPCHTFWLRRNAQPRRGPSLEGGGNGPRVFYCPSASSNKEILKAKQKSWTSCPPPEHGWDWTAGRQGGQGSFWGPRCWSFSLSTSLESGWGRKEHTFLHILQVGLPLDGWEWGVGRGEASWGCKVPLA